MDHLPPTLFHFFQIGKLSSIIKFYHLDKLKFYKFLCLAKAAQQYVWHFFLTEVDDFSKGSSPNEIFKKQNGSSLAVFYKAMALNQKWSAELGIYGNAQVNSEYSNSLVSGRKIQACIFKMSISLLSLYC